MSESNAEVVQSVKSSPTVSDNKVVGFPDPNEDPVEVAAMMFSMYLPKMEILIDSLSGKAVKRVLKSLIRVPLVDTTFNGRSENENNAFSVGARLFEAKWLMMLSALSDNQKQVSEAKTDSEVKTNNEEGKTNGS